MPATGDRVGRYEILAPLGSGGMGEVYRALDTQLNRHVAVKFLAVDFATPSARRRFQQEAQMASALNHPHILTVHEAGEVDGRQYLVTELVDGGTLADWAIEGERTWRQVLTMVVGVADALAAAHDAGIMHRDVKPANILISKSGYAKLADFGLAKIDTPASPHAVTSMPVVETTRSGVVLGTVPYMSPEQALGRAIDPRSDIFSFGLVLYELLARHRAFAARSDVDTLHAIVHDAAEPLPAHVPIGLRLVVEKALEKDPADRFQSMRELVVDLRREARRTVEHPITPVATIPGRTSRRWLLAAASLAIAVVAAALIWGVPWFSRSAREPENPLANARFTRVTDFAGDEFDAAISPDGRFVAFVSDRDGQFDVWLSQIGSGSFRNLTLGKDPMLPAPVRAPGFSADGSQVWIGGGSGRRLQIMPLMGGAPRPYLSERAVNVSWSPDNQRLAFHTRDAGDPIFVADRDGSNARQIFVGANPGVHNHFPVWSRDGRWLFFVAGSPATSEMDLWRIAPEGGMPERLTNHNSDVGYPTPIDASTVLYVARDESGAGPWLWALDVEQRRSRRISLGLEQYTSVSASADGSRLVATVANPSSTLWTVPILDRVADERDVQPFPVSSVNATMPQFAAGSLFYVSAGGSGKGLWRYRDSEAVEFWRAGDNPLPATPGVSRDSGRVAIALRRNGKLRLHLLSSDGAEVQPLTDSIDVRGSSSWSPDQKWVVTGGSDASGDGLFKVPVDGGPVVRLATGQALDPVWSPDGNTIVYVGPNIGSQSPLLAVRPDGSVVALPSIQVRREGGGIRTRFLPDSRGLVYMQGLVISQDFRLLDLETGRSRQLTTFNHGEAMWGFDVSPDGKQIVFDRARNASDIVLIELPRNPAR
jgi:serine/threonine protein kinase/Tol biopolymer transport system component